MKKPGWKMAAAILGVAGTVMMLTGAASSSPYDWHLPAWVPTPVVPADNPMSVAKVELGRYLFYDKRLSADGSMACASCHEQKRAFTDGKVVPTGVNGEPGFKNAMALANVAYLPVLTWANPNLKRLETQALVPIFGDHPVEMGMAGREELLLKLLREDKDYPALFRSAFPESTGEISLSTITRAIAAFERTLLSFNAPYDRYKYAGEANAISDSAKRGEALFFGERLECYHCHGGLNFTDNIQHARSGFPEIGFHNDGLYNLDGNGAYPANGHGLREFTGEAGDEGKFRTPSLRNITLTAPYMHDGSIPTLAAVIKSHYAKKGRAVHDGKPANPLRSQFIEGFAIDDDEVMDLLAFLETLTDRDFIADPRFADPFRQ